MDQAERSRIYLVRHGEPLPPGVDVRRPLSPAGERDVHRVALRLVGSMAAPPQRILHSGRLRAAQTAGILADRLGIPSGAQQAPGLAPGDETHPWARELDGAGEDLMIVGHMPFLADLRAVMTDGPFEPFRTAEVACLENSGGVWRQSWSVAPEDIDEPRTENE